MRPVDQHRHTAPASVRVGIVTVSDTRTLDTDESGSVVADLMAGAGHEIVGRRLVPDEPAEVRAAVLEQLAAGAQLVVTNGGTGIAARDSTFEALDALLEKRLPGFGELFRALSYPSVGPAAMMSRATAGTARGGVVIVLPGSPDAVRLAIEKIVLPEARHLAKLATRAPATDAAAGTLTHVDARGQAHMVDVGDKAITRREASAQAVVTLSPAAFAAIEGNAKGDVLAVARVAGIQAAKRTSELIPLCHPLALTKVTVDLTPEPGRPGVRIVATARTDGKTGVEMEALVAASVAALTVYDMLKAVDRGITIGDVQLVSKSGGKSGTWSR